MDTAQVDTESFSPGTVVSARGRLWRVDQQDGDVLTATPIGSGDAEQQRFYVPVENVTRSQLDWPSRELIGTPQAQDLLLRAHRLSMLHGTAPLLSLQRSRVIPKNFQLVPVVMALEMRERVRMLLADDVGLGKTIEAGLIITELMARQRASRALVVVPAALREQWREALDYFFHLPARIISSRHRREMERELPAGTSPWGQFPVLITSIDYAKQPAVKNQILEQDWDIALFDEAHLAAKPHETSPGQSASTQRWEFAQAVATSERIQHLLLLTATPHNGYTDSFTSLLRLLGEDLVSGASHDPTIRGGRATDYVCQRRRQDVQEWFGEAPSDSPFPDRDQEEIIVPPTAYEREAIEAVEEYGQQVLSSAEKGSAQTRTLANWTVLHLHKRAISSPEALRQSLQNRKESLQQRIEEELEAEVSISEDEVKANVFDEDTGERLDSEEASKRTERSVFGDVAAIESELEKLETAIEAAAGVTPSRDNKRTRLLQNVLPDRLREDPKVIIFTRYVDTLEYLEGQIGGSDRFADTEVFTIHGGLPERKRREVFRSFDRADKAVLVATDAISEGMNLQHASAQVIHYELPWNPNRLEQRNGRVDRFGQQKDTVHIRTMVMDETLDASIMSVLVEKAAEIRRQYGFSPPYFGEETDIMELLAQHDIKVGPQQLHLFDEEEEPGQAPGGAKDSAQDPFSSDTLDRIEGDSFYGQTSIHLPDIQKRLEETKETIGSPEQIEHFVRSGLSRFGCDVEENVDSSLKIKIAHPELRTASVGRVIERATFDPAYGLDNPDVVTLDLGHPLVRRLVELVKQETFRPSEEHYGRTSYYVVEEAEEVAVVFHLLARYAVAGETGAPSSVLEELVPVGLPVYGNRALPEARTEALLKAEAAPQTRTDAEVRETIEDLFSFRENLQEALREKVDRRRSEIAEERRQMQEELAGQGDGQATDWTEGIDAVAEGSFDVLTMTVYYPA
jgi:SNF2 family DNA or RNA helicase